MEMNDNLSIKAQQDFVLVQKAMEGDQRAFAELMNRYRDAIYFMLLKMVNNKTEAEDLTIEAFGKAFRYLGQYAPNFAFSTWLFKIATNNCIDFIRKKKNEIVIVDTGNEGNDHDPSVPYTNTFPDPEEVLIKEQKETLMRLVVSKLKPRYKTLIELRYFQEYSYEEISAEMKLPVGTVKAQLFRARELLYNIIKNSHDSI
jgi:RNA polymerase sigma factor (sigma-70 family)